MRGRLKKSSEDKYGHTPPVGQDFVVDSGLPEKPKGLSRLARREWDRIVELLLPKGGVTKLDGKALAAYCEAYARSEEANRLIDLYGLMVPVYLLDKASDLPLKDSDGKFVVKEWRRNPATLIHKDYLMVQRAYLDMFGLSPKSRMSLKISDKPKINPLAELRDAPVMGFQAGAPAVKPGRQFTQPATPAVNENLPVKPDETIKI